MFCIFHYMYFVQLTLCVLIILCLESTLSNFGLLLPWERQLISLEHLARLGKLLVLYFQVAAHAWHVFPVRVPSFQFSSLSLFISPLPLSR